MRESYRHPWIRAFIQNFAVPYRHKLYIASAEVKAYEVPALQFRKVYLFGLFPGFSGSFGLQAYFIQC